MKKEDLPKIISIFPLSNFIIFPNTTVPLNIFEPRYIDMVNDSMSHNKLIGMIQPKIKPTTYRIFDAVELKNHLNPDLHEIGCMGKITSFKEIEDGKFLIELKGIIRFQIIKEIQSKKKYREYEINFSNFYDDLDVKIENIQFSDLKLIFKDLKKLFEKRGFIINWKGLEKQSLDETINALAMASPFTLAEKQILLEAKNLETRKKKISEILTTYSFDDYNNTTVQ